MPFTCVVDSRQRRGTLTISGAVDSAAIMEAMAALYRHPDWRPGFQALWDARGVTRLSVDPDDLERLVAEVTTMVTVTGAGRSAYVVPDEVQRGIAHIVFRRQPPSGRNRRLFKRIEGALAWLDEEVAEESGA